MLAYFTRFKCSQARWSIAKGEREDALHDIQEADTDIFTRSPDLEVAPSEVLAQIGRFAMQIPQHSKLAAD